MKRFFVFAIWLGCSLVLMGQHRASEKTVPPQVLLDNAKVRMVRWVLKPGEGTPVHSHTLDHIAVVIRGSTLREVDVKGSAKETTQKAGEASYVPAHGVTHSFANVGKDTFEEISIELKK